MALKIRKPAWAVVAFALLATAAMAVPASAQTLFFGKNKVQYTDFDWAVLESEHFDLYFYPEEDTLALTALRVAEESYEVLASRFRHEVERRIPLIIYSTHHHFEETNISPFFLPEGVAGFTEFAKGRVALPFNGSYHDFEHVIWHELVHVFQLSRVAEAYRLHYRNSFVSPPLWFTEGMAELWSGEWDSTGDLFLRDMLLNDLLPPISGLWRYDGSFVTYKVGQDLTGFLEREFGPDVIPELYDELWRVNSFAEALENVTEMPLAVLSELWHHDLQKRYYPHVQESSPVLLEAQPIAVKGGGNFQPTIPPSEGPLDPESFYFFSPRNGFMNVYRASINGRERNVETVIKGQRQPEFESFHGFESKMSINHEGMLTFVSKFHDRDAIFLYDAVEQELVDHWQFEGLVALRSPTFSPDGKRVAFAGLTESGYQDLYLFELGGDSVQPLTKDRYFEDDPAWSPDGRTIAFVSDRTPWGNEGGRNLYLLDIESGEMTPVTQGPWVDGSPAWDETGKRLAYSSDRDGTPQIFVADSTLASVRVTSLLGGASSPVFIPGTDEMLFTGMSKLQFGIFRIPVEAKGDTLASPEEVLPMLAMASDSLGVPSPELWPAWQWNVGADSVLVRKADYKSHFSLDFAQGGVALDPVQGVGEGLQAMLSDQLGNRVFFIQFSNTATSFGELFGRFNAGVTYMNLEQRFNYGGSVYHFAADFLDERGFRYFERRVGGSLIGSYPYSKFSRIEGNFGVYYSDKSPDSFRPARTALIAANYLSLIYDNTLWFGSGPIDGHRYRFTLGLNANVPRVEVENVSAIVDLRKYFRLSLRSAYAVRFQGSISQGSFPQRFVIGGPWSFRGYPRRSLVGTRAVLINQEIRFPLLDGVLLGIPSFPLGFPGVQGALFFDMGQAWEDEQGLREILGSYGVGLRSSLGGYLVMRLDFAKRTNFKRVFPRTEVDFSVGFNY